MSNIIKFPKQIKQDIPLILNVQEVKENIDYVKSLHVQETLNFIMSLVFQQLYVAGFDIDLEDEEYAKDGALFVESLRAMLHRYHDLGHPFQELSEQLFKADDLGSFIINDELHMSFNETDAQDDDIEE